MKLSELIEQLLKLQSEHGDVFVATQGGCGCCQWSRDPEPRYQPNDPWDGSLFDENEYPGVYL